MPSEHSTTVGSSTAARIIACPASYKLSQQMPEQVESSYAKEGTMLHAAIEDILNERFVREEDVIGFTHGGVSVTPDLYHEMLVPALTQFDEHFRYAEFITEQRVNFPGIPESFGTADITGYTDDATIIVDWKFGRGVEVEAKKNAQLLYCAAAGRHTVKKFFKRDKPIIGAIIQPAKGGIKKWQFTHEDVDVFEQKLIKAWAQANSPKPRMEDGSHCKFCRAKPICPVKRDKIKRVQQIGKVTNEHYDPNELGELMHLALDMEAWAKDIKKLAHEELERGVAIKGWKLVAKRAIRRWMDDAAADKFMKGMRMKVNERNNLKTISPAQAEKWVKAHSSKRAFKTRTKTLTSLVTSTSSGNTLAPSDDKRPAIENLNTKIGKLK